MPTELTITDLSDIANKINEGIEKYSVETLTDTHRNHLGISGIGDNCSRKIWYGFRWVKFEQFDGRMLRLFKRGHREETRFISYLEGIGCKTYQHDADGKQFRVSGVMGHYGGSCDGVAMTPWADVPFLLEFKTHNSKSFLNYLSKGLHKSKPMHFDQMSGYAYKMDLHYGIYLPENKNDDDIKVSVVKLDHNRGAQLERKAEEIILSQEAPARISENPAYFDCNWCNFKDICHYDETPEKSCRSCRNAVPVENAEWRCNRYELILPKDKIAFGCGDWTPL